MLIADHARKDPPVGSISWKWIEESVKNGRLEDIENYRAGPAEPQIREVGSGQPTRKGRVKFTAEDDRILAEWCTRAERKGLLLRGNEVYKQLALKVAIASWWSVDMLTGIKASKTYVPIMARSLD